MTAVQMADLFVDTICYKHGRGVPLSVLSDNNKLSTANFFKSLFERLGTEWKFSTARTQSTDGQAERYVACRIAVVEEILRTCVNYSQDDWEVRLSAIMFVINNQEKNANKRVLFLDCREKEERAVSIIPGASSAEEFDDFEEQDDGKETIVVCYCTIGYRSQKKVQELSKRLAQSRPDVKAYNLSGSIVAWTHETVAPKLLDPETGKETNRVHTYGKTWALQSVEYESVVYKRPVFEVIKGLFFKKK